MPKSWCISVQALLNAEEKVTCTATQTNRDAIEAIVSSANGIPIDEDAINQDKSQDRQSEMELVGSILEDLAAVGHLKRFNVDCGDKNGVLINRFRGL